MHLSKLLQPLSSPEGFLPPIPPHLGMEQPQTPNLTLVQPNRKFLHGACPVFFYYIISTKFVSD